MLAMTVTVVNTGKARISSVEYTKINHVITVKTHGKRCLVKTYEKLNFGTYNPDVFSALTLHFENPHVTVIIFSTGNITVMGCSTLWGALYVLQWIKHKLNLKFMKIKLTNVVVKFNIINIKKQVDIVKLYESNKSDCACDVDTFPSCTYSVPGTNIKANFFNSGKIVVAGCSSDEQVIAIINKLVDLIHKFYDNEIKVVDKKLLVEGDSDDETFQQHTANANELFRELSTGE
jgi:TATA-box binding protein (TBP) (component of TFIID and TFIIIB)